VDLSAVKKQDGPLAVMYEAFHYLKPPRANDLTCTVIKALGDKFDMLAFYSDFRIDNPEPARPAPVRWAVDRTAAGHGNRRGTTKISPGIAARAGSSGSSSSRST